MHLLSDVTHPHQHSYHYFPLMEYIKYHHPNVQRLLLTNSRMHQHPTKFVPTDFYLRMPFLALELHLDEGGPSAAALEGTYRKILAQKPLVVWGNIGEADLDWLMRHLPAAGLAIITVVPSPERAAEIWNRCFGSR